MRPPLVEPVAYLISPGTANPENYQAYKKDFLKIAHDAASHGVGLIQLREKALPARLVYEFCIELVGALEGTLMKVLVNERVDIAVSAGAAGVHLPQDGPDASELRRAFGKELLIGVSTHMVSEVVEAERDGADLAVFGPVFETPGKGKPVGLNGLREACVAVEIPLLALGGVDESNAEEVLRAGAAGFAAIRWLNDEAGLLQARRLLK